MIRRKKSGFKHSWLKYEYQTKLSIRETMLTLASKLVKGLNRKKVSINAIVNWSIR